MRIYDKRDGISSFPLVFDQLEDLEFYCYWSILWPIEFAGSNNLKRLKLYGGYEPNFGEYQLKEIVEKWPNLEEVSLQFDNIKEIRFLMSNLKQLKKIVIQDVKDRGRENDFVELASNLGSGWKVEELDVKDVIIITKT